MGQTQLRVKTQGHGTLLVPHELTVLTLAQVLPLGNLK